jgi:hypothetical protein
LSGALNIWSFTPSVFDPFEAALIAVCTTAVSAVTRTAARWATARTQAHQLRVALDTRDRDDRSAGSESTDLRRQRFGGQPRMRLAISVRQIQYWTTLRLT